MPIRWTPQATDDLYGICQYIAKESPVSALRTGRTLYRGIARLSSFPKLGRPGRKAGTRELVFTPLPYIVVYRINERTIEILHIWHGSQKR